MGAVAANPPLRCGPRSLGKTAFERNLLPGFAHWVVQQIERRQPDFLIPAETKGVRVLEAVLTYAREELGTPITVPVLYASALAYVDRETLRSSRVMIIDDAVRTGITLDRHRAWVAGRQVADIQAIACIGLNEETPERRLVDCYISVDAALYDQYNWELTELVVSRGLPPEVDHFIFEARLPGRLPPAWRRLRGLLGRYGELTVDGSAARRDEIVPLTLHFPRLPAPPGLPPASLHRDAPNKVRLFPDLSANRFFVVPISLPALTLGAAAGETEPLSLERARERIRATLGHSDPVCDLLLAEAETLEPKAVFRALSACMEIELIRGFSQLLGMTFPGASLGAQREPFERLFGPATGRRLVSLVGAQVEEALARGAEMAGEAEEHPTPVEPAEPVFLDTAVVERTRLVAERLKALYDEDAARPGHDPSMRFGRSMPEIAAEACDDDALLASRCISHGLAMTTLVPYIESRREENGTLKVERLYRVSEKNRGFDRPYTDINRVRRDKSEQALAVICNRIRTRCAAYREKPVPIEILTGLVGILRPLVLSKHSIELAACSGDESPRIVLLDGPAPIRLDEQPSTVLDVIAGAEPGEGDGVAPTKEFLALYKEKRLALDLDGSTEEIEAHVDLLTPFAGKLDRDGRDALLNGWAMSVDERLGLQHVGASLEAALVELRKPLRLMLRRQEHVRTTRTAAQVASCAAKAREKLELLRGDWSAPPRRRWKDAGRREQRLLDSLGAPEKPTAVYDLPEALAALIEALGRPVERLDAVSVRGWVEGEDEDAAAAWKADAATVATEALRWCAATRRALTSLVDDGYSQRPPEDPRAAVSTAAAELLDVADLLGAFAAAVAGEFRGPSEDEIEARVTEEKRHVAILSLDLVGSTGHGLRYGAEKTHLWKNAGLDIAAQWTRAFGGWPVSDRRGDDMAVEFGPGDAAVLCAAAVQQHAAALSSTGNSELDWGFHAGVDSGQVQNGTEGVSGPCIDRASKLAKECDEGATESTFVTQEAHDGCSPELREPPLATPQEEIAIDAGEGTVVSHRPYAVDSKGAMRRFVERARELAERIAAETPPLREVEPDLHFEQGGDEELGEYSEAGAG